MKFYERTKKVDEIFKGKMIQLHVETVELPDGREATREVVRHPGAVAVLPLTEDGRLIVVEQFRKALDRSIIEIPAGKLEAGEAPLACAIRELKEETGYSSDEISYLVSFSTSPGFADEIIHLYLAQNCKPGKNHLDEDEFLDLMLISKEDAYQMIANQQIYDAKTILAIYYWDLLSKRD